MHDTFLQSVQGLLLRFASATRKIEGSHPVRSLLDELLDRSDEVISEARDSIHNLNLYLIAQEAMLNAARHAEAGSIELEIAYLPGEIRLSIRDDGQGIDAETLEHGRRGHWGLQGIRERAKTIGARLRIMSKQGVGTEIEVVIAAAIASPPRSTGSGVI